MDYSGLEFTDWGEWEECSVTCGDGVRYRFRTCTAGCENIDADDANHSLDETEACSQTACKFII